MIKKARKSSTDPVQEKLREDKSVLNKKITSFINDLIHLKKMMNGWNSKFYNQKSKIIDPIPADPSTIISSLANDYNEIAREQLKIVQKQSEYSKNRKQKQPKKINTNPDQLSLFNRASVDYNLISLSSNPITRFFARLLNPGIGFGEAARIRRYRNSLLTASIDLYRNIETFQGLIMGLSAESIFSASKFLIKIENQWSFLRQGFLTYRLNMPDNVSDTGGTITKEIVPDEKVEKSDKTINESNKEEKKSLVFEANDAIKDFRSNIDNFIDLNKKELNLLIMEYVSATDAEKEILAPKVLSMYNELVSDANEIYSTNEKKLELIFKKINKTAMKKLAKSFLKRHFGKAYHQLNPLDKTSAFRLDIFNISDECLESLDKIMDSLEKTMDVQDLSEHFAKININILKVRQLMNTLDTTIRGVSFDRPFMDMLDKKEILEHNTNLNDHQREQLSKMIDQRQIRDISNFYLQKNKHSNN